MNMMNILTSSHAAKKPSWLKLLIGTFFQQSFKEFFLSSNNQITTFQIILAISQMSSGRWPRLMWLEQVASEREESDSGPVFTFDVMQRPDEDGNDTAELQTTLTRNTRLTE